MSGSYKGNQSETKKARLNDEDLWGDELDENTVEECFFLASQALSQSAPPEAPITSIEAQPSKSDTPSKAGEFKVPPAPHFKPKQSSSRSFSSSVLAKKFPSTSHSEKFPKKVPASASQSETFPQKRQSSPTQLDVISRKTLASQSRLDSHSGAKVVSASRSVDTISKAPLDLTAFSVSKSTGKKLPSGSLERGEIGSSRPTWPFSSRAGETSSMKPVRSLTTSSNSMEVDSARPVRPTGTVPICSSVGNRMLGPIIPERTVPIVSTKTDSRELERALGTCPRMSSCRVTGALLNTSMFPTSGITPASKDNQDGLYREVQQLRVANKKLQEDLLTRDGEVAILRTQLVKLKTDLEKQRLSKVQEVEHQASMYQEKTKELEKELEQKSTLLNFKILEAGNAEERCRMLQSRSKVKLVEPQPSPVPGKFPANPVPPTLVKEKEQDVNEESTTEKGKDKPEEKTPMKRNKEKGKEERHCRRQYQPCSRGLILTRMVSPCIFERPMYGVEREPERPPRKEHGKNLTPYGVTVDVTHSLLTRLILHDEFEESLVARQIMDQLIWKCYTLLKKQFIVLKQNKVPMNQRKADYFDQDVCEETGKIYMDETVNIMSARQWFKDEQSVEIRRTLGLMATLADISKHAASYMSGNIRQKIWVKTILTRPPEIPWFLRKRIETLNKMHRLRKLAEEREQMRKAWLLENSEAEKRAEMKRMKRIEQLRQEINKKNIMMRLVALNKAITFVEENWKALKELTESGTDFNPEVGKALIEKIDKGADELLQKFKRKEEMRKFRKVVHEAMMIEEAYQLEQEEKPKKEIKPKSDEEKEMVICQTIAESFRTDKERNILNEAHEKELDAELLELGLKREDWINVDPDEEAKKHLSPVSWLRNYVIKCRKMGRHANIKPLSSLKPRSPRLVKRPSPPVIDLECDSLSVDNESPKQNDASVLPLPAKPTKKSEKIYHIHPMKWNMITEKEARKRMNTGGQFEILKAEFTPLKQILDRKAKLLLPSPLEKIEMMKEELAKRKLKIKRQRYIINPFLYAITHPAEMTEKLKNLTPEELEKMRQVGAPHWQGPQVDFLQFLYDMVQIIAEQRWTVTCNGILFAIAKLLKIMVTRARPTEERYEMVAKLIKELLLCRPSINVLTEVVLVLYRIGRVKGIQERLCTGKGPNPYLGGRFGLVFFYQGQARYDMGPEEDVYHYDRSSCMITLITWMSTLLRADVEHYYMLGMSMLLWMSSASCCPLYGPNWIGPLVEKEVRNCQCRPRIIEALIILMHACYEHLEKNNFKSYQHRVATFPCAGIEHAFFMELNDFFGTALRFFKRMIYKDNDMGLLMTNTEAQYQIVIRGLWDNVDKMVLSADDRNALQVLKELEDQVDASVPKLEPTEEEARMLNEVLDKVVNWAKLY